MRLTLCGSTRFRKEYEATNALLSKQGHLVYSVSCFGHSGDALTPAEKETLDRVHLQKIDNSDGIVVLNVDGYVGESTRREIEHAKATGKRIFCLSACAPVGQIMCPHAGCSNSVGGQPCAVCYE